MVRSDITQSELTGHGLCCYCRDLLELLALIVLLDQVHEATVAAGAYPSPLNYHNFPKSVCTSVNEVQALLPTRHRACCRGSHVCHALFLF